MTQPATKARLRNSPDCKKLSASPPSGRDTTAVEVTKTITSRGTKITAMVRNWRRRYASRPLLDGLGDLDHLRGALSAARTLRISERPTSRASTAVAAEKTSQNHSAPPNSKTW